MSQSIEIAVRLSLFLILFGTFAGWEILAPRRHLTVRKSPRWASNLGLAMLNSVAERMVIPVTAVGAAYFAQSRGWGLLSWVPWPPWLETGIGFVALDLAIYFQHRMFHRVPVLWRLHLVHHADLDIDVSTGLRFHTLEILLSALIKLAAVVGLGASPLAVVIFEVVLNGTSMFNHGNLRIPLDWDRWLRWMLVTPDMHRVHHSMNERETNSNFGFNLPWWDRIFGTYHGQPDSGHQDMVIGLAEFRDEQVADRLPRMLILPLTRRVGSSRQ